MYELIVSYDAGSNYCVIQSSENLDDLRPKMEELDNDGLRWRIDKDGVQINDMDDCVCKIYKKIIVFLENSTP